MEAVEARFPGIKVFSLPSVDHPQYGRHIELGVKDDAVLLDPAYAALRVGLDAQPGVRLGPELVRWRAATGPQNGAIRRPALGLRRPLARAVAGMVSATFLCAFLRVLTL